MLVERSTAFVFLIVAEEEKCTDSKRVCGSGGSSSVGAVGVPVVREEADFGLAGGDDALQAGLLGRVAHVIQHPVQQLVDRDTEMLKDYFYFLLLFDMTLR